MLLYKTFLIFVLSVGLEVFSATVEPIVTLPQGKIKGKIEVARNGRNFVSYLGIPFVKKPERFQEGGEAPKWIDLRDGTKFGSQCPQFDRKSKMVVGNEDCLFINVFTPEVPNQPTTAVGVKSPSSTTTTTAKSVSTSPQKKLYPVIIHIHGGSFVAQSSDLFGPEYLLSEEVILVSFNYRLGVFGFFSTGDKETVSNLALRDQIQALKWVKSNIHLFGGDSSRVTLLGAGSAGGALASYLMISPMAQGLFSSVISLSGNALCPWAIVHNPGKIAAKLATKLNCPNTQSTKEIVNCIKSKGVKDVVIARVALQGFTEDPAVAFAPVVESWLAKEGNPVVAEPPLKSLSEGKFTKVPWFSGVNSLNGVNLGVATILTTPKRLLQLDQEWGKLAPIIFHYSQTAPHPSNVSDSIREFYFGNKNISFETKDKFINALGDRNFISCTAKAASIQSKFAPVFLYHLGYQGANSFLDDWGLKDKLKVARVVHGDELQHIFTVNKLGNFPQLKKGDKHSIFSEKIVKLVTTFAANGKPMEMGEKAGAEWTPIVAYTPTAQLPWYNLDGSVMSRQIIFEGAKQASLWEELDLGGFKYKASVHGPGKFTIGYEMPPGKPGGVAPTASGAGSKPVGVSQGVTPGTGKPLVTPGPSVVQITPGKVTPGVAVGSLLLRDEDPSSTTTTTTKKPGFFSKIIGG